MAIHPETRKNTPATSARQQQPIAEPVINPSRHVDIPRPVAGVLRHGLLALARQPVIGRVATRLPMAQRVAHRFVAGESLNDAVEAVRRLNADGVLATLDHLGENVTTTAEAFLAAGAYVDALDASHANGLRSNVSLKLTQMGLDIDAGLGYENVARICERARRHDNFVRIDMEGSRYTQTTFDVHRRLFKQYGNVGVVIQTYLYRSQADVEDMIAMKARVRLCKGAYAEPASIAFQRREDVDRNYRRLMERLLLAGTYPAFATHDESLIRWACHFAGEHGIDRERFEFQFLYGIRRDLQESLTKAGYNVRVYVPYGRDWYRYFMRRLAERPANLLFFLTNL